MTIRFDPAAAAAVLRRTPGTLRALLSGLPEQWLHAAEGADTFTPTAPRAPGASLDALLDQLAEARHANLAELASLLDGGLDLDRAGMHPELGRVTARQLKHLPRRALARWLPTSSAS